MTCCCRQAHLAQSIGHQGLSSDREATQHAHAEVGDLLDHRVSCKGGGTQACNRGASHYLAAALIYLRPDMKASFQGMH